MMASAARTTTTTMHPSSNGSSSSSRGGGSGGGERYKNVLYSGMMVWIIMVLMILYTTQHTLTPFLTVTRRQSQTQDLTNHGHGSSMEEEMESEEETETSLVAGRRGRGEQPLQQEPPSLPELVRVQEDSSISCPDGFYPVHSIVNSNEEEDRRRIPKIIHMTGKSKCVTKPFYANIQAWQQLAKDGGYSFYFHDDQSVHTLLKRQWEQFPQIQNTYYCLQNAGGAAMADLWRYLALWQYGGIYTDMDTRPNVRFHANDTITPQMDGFFLIEEQFKILTQWFFATSPKHPIMFLALMDVMSQLHNPDLVQDIGTFDVSYVSGPHCLHRAFETFRGIPTINKSKKRFDKDNLPTGGPNGHTYYWKESQQSQSNNKNNNNNNNRRRSITVVGSHKNGEQWITRVAFSKHVKFNQWRAMNYSNYRELNKVPANKTCLDLLLEKNQQQQQQQQ